MVLTREMIKDASEKNELLSEILEFFREWGKACAQDLDCGSQLKELDENYHSGLKIVEQRVQEKITSIAETGREMLADLQREADNLREERKKALVPILQKSNQEIQEKEKEILVLKSNLSSALPMLPKRQKEARERIAQLEKDIASIKESCEREARRFARKIRDCEGKQEQVRKEYLSKECGEELRKSTFEDFKKLYEKRKAEILSRGSSDSLEKWEKELEEHLPPEYVREFCEALNLCSVNGDTVFEGNNRRFVAIGRRMVVKPQWPPEVNGIVSRKFSCMDGGAVFQVPFAVNQNGTENIPVLIYGGSMDGELKRRFQTLCTAYCLSRCLEPLQILYMDGLKETDILPEAYRKANPDIFFPIPRGKEAVCLKRLEDLCEKVKKLLDEKKYAGIMEYNAEHKDRALPHCLLVMEDLPDSFGEEELSRLVYLMREGGRYGVKILACLEFEKIMSRTGPSSLELRRYLERCGYGYEPDQKNFSVVGSGGDEGEYLDIQPLTGWDAGKASRVSHRALCGELPHFDPACLKEKEEQNPTEPKKTPKTPKPHKEPEPSVLKGQKKAGFLKEFLENRTLPEAVYFPAESGGKSLAITGDAGHCVRIVSRSRKQYEDTVFYLLMQLMLWNISENRKGNPKHTVYYFNFCENVMTETDPCLGLYCCDKLQYVSPDVLAAGLKLCLEDLKKSMRDHTMWLFFSGMEYMNFYQGYEEEEEKEISEYYGKLDRYLDTGNCHVFLAGASVEACSRLCGGGNVPSLTFHLDQRKILHRDMMEELTMWPSPEERELREFEERIVKY